MGFRIRLDLLDFFILLVPPSYIYYTSFDLVEVAGAITLSLLIISIRQYLKYRKFKKHCAKPRVTVT